jgi:hypothetical protein
MARSSLSVSELSNKVDKKNTQAHPLKFKDYVRRLFA